MINVVSTTSQIFNVCKRTSFYKPTQEELAKKLEETMATDSFCFSGYDLSVLDFCGLRLDKIIFYQCILNASSFDGASLNDARFVNCFAPRSSFRGADMYWASIENSIFDYCDFSGCIMEDVLLKSSSFVGSGFVGAVLLPNVVINDTDFSAAKIDCIDAIDFRTLSHAKNVPNLPMTCPDNGAFIGWKKCRDNVIVKLLISENAKRSSSTGRKCRCDKAVVLELQDLSGRKLSDDVVAYSKYNSDFEYRVGAMVSVDDFCEDRWEECAPGIHFFINRQEAVDY